MSGERKAGERSPGDKLFHKECKFVAGAMTLEQLPPMGPIEVAFAGRSNVGKSSLVKWLQQQFGMMPFFEPNEENPYLSDFYADMPRWRCAPVHRIDERRGIIRKAA